MWTRLKKKLLQIFSNDKQETKNITNDEPLEESKHAINQQQNKRSFRFPVIPDEPIKKAKERYNVAEDQEILIWQRNKYDTGKRHLSYTQHKEKINKSPKLDHRSRGFVPSQVISPIYGYHKRRDRDAIEQVPAFMRQKQKESSTIKTKSNKEKANDDKIKDRENFVKAQDSKTFHQRNLSDKHRVDNILKGKCFEEMLAGEQDKSPKHSSTSFIDKRSVKEKTVQPEVGKNETTLEVIEPLQKQTSSSKRSIDQSEQPTRINNDQPIKSEQQSHIHSEHILTNVEQSLEKIKQQQDQPVKQKDERAKKQARKKNSSFKQSEEPVKMVNTQATGLIEQKAQKPKQPRDLFETEPTVEEMDARKTKLRTQNKNVEEQDRSLKQKEYTSRRKKQRQRKEKQVKQSSNKKQKNKKTTATTVPFNVMMTPADYKKLAETKKKQTKKTYKVPYHLLNDPKERSKDDAMWVSEQIEILEQTLKHFNVDAKVVHATQGPTVTRFEVKPAIGVKVSRVRNLSDDIKLNMAAKDIRIEAPIPGKNTIGIEIPNLNPQMVVLQEIFQTDEFQRTTKRLPVGLGLTVEGKPLITTVEKMPHGLIAGATGSGKSVCINTILLSLIYKESYEDLRLLLIDPKMVELAPYNGIPHLVSPVITDVKAATAALKWAVIEMEERYEKFVTESVRDISRYNEKMIEAGSIDDKLPHIVIVIDELADLMMISPQDVEDAICRIAQKARAAGMHLIIATQRPSVDVITGLIKANIPTRIAFSVSSQVDSRTILDTTGAERLLGRGDMLFVENGAGKGVRLQGAFVSDEEIDRVTSYLRQLAPANYLFEQKQLLKQIEVTEEEDELFVDAILLILEHHQASTSMLQRHLRIGYNRAARLIDSLEDKGIISGPQGSKPRQVLMSEEQLDEIINAEQIQI